MVFLEVGRLELLSEEEWDVRRWRAGFLVVGRGNEGGIWGFFFFLR